MTSLLDATIVASGFGVVAWVLLIQPFAADQSAPMTARIVAAAYPVMSVLRFAIISRLAVGPGRRPAALVLLTAGIGLLVLVDLVYALQQLQGVYDGGQPLDAGWMLGYVLLGASALHPTSEQLSEPAVVAKDRHLRTPRIVFLATATLLAPVMALFAPQDARLLLNLSSIWLFALVLVRMGSLARALERAVGEVAELQRRRGERRFRSLVQKAADVVVVVGSDDTVTFATPSAERFVGSNMIGWSMERLLSWVEPDDLETFMARIGAVRSRPGAVSAPLQIRIRQSDGEVRHFEVIATNLLDDPDVGGVVLNARDVTERAVLEEQLRHQAFHDPLTGLANRTLFGDRVQHALDRAARSNRRVAVLFCDLDDFKTVNDSLGHAAGDRLLTVVAARLERCLRVGDTAARLGGDEFGLLLEDLSHDGPAVEVADRVLTALGQPVAVDGRSIVAGVSIGIAFGSTGHRSDDVLRNADAAMYTAKAAGKGRWARYTPSMHTDALHRLQLIGDLDRALDEGELFLAYQPIVELASGVVVGVEALARWEHPQRGLVPPSEFIPVAEETGQVLEVGRRVLRQACLQTASWLALVPDDTEFRVSVNVSARQLRDPGLVDEVITSLEQAGLAADRLVLELTESVLLEDPDQAMLTFTELQHRGVTLAIDDFGTGFSSLSYLRRLPVHIIKIDKSFVDDLGDGSQRRPLTGGIVDLTRTLGVTALAEGIEHAAQVADLRAMGCELGQGYHYARPLDPEAVTQLLTAGRSLPPEPTPTAQVAGPRPTSPG